MHTFSFQITGPSGVFTKALTKQADAQAGSSQWLH
jgi:hypothetical protein